MSKLSNPIPGQSVINWAKKATKEINAKDLQAGNGILLNKTDAGTTIALNLDKAIPHPDSYPYLLSGNAYSKSIERQKDDNTYTIYDFRDKDNIKDLDKLSAYYNSFIMRCWPNPLKDSSLSSEVPNVKYVSPQSFLTYIDNYLEGALSTLSADLSGETKTDASGNKSKSIQYNAVHELENYRFDRGEIWNPPTLNGVTFMVREYQTDEDRPELKYIDLPNNDGWKNYITSTIVEGALSAISADSESISATSYSIQHNDKNELELYKFDEEIITPANAYNQEILIREIGGEGVAPELKYVEMSAVTHTQLTDSENIIHPIGKSLERNTQDELAIYGFETLSNRVRITTKTPNTDIIVRQLDDETEIPTVKYAALSAVFENALNEDYHFNTIPVYSDDDKIVGIAVYIGSLDEAVMINSVPIANGGNPRLTDGWNVFNRVNALYVTIDYAQVGANNIKPTDIVNEFVWNIVENPGNVRYKIPLAKVVDNEFIKLRSGVIEVGAIIPDSANGDLVGTFMTKSLEYADNTNIGPGGEQSILSKTGLKLYGWSPQVMSEGAGSIGANQSLANWYDTVLNGNKNNDALAILYRDCSGPNGTLRPEQGELKYISISTLDKLLIPDADVFRYKSGMSRSIQNIDSAFTPLEGSPLGYGHRLYNFVKYDDDKKQYQYPKEPANFLDNQDNLDYSEVVIRKHGRISQVPEVSYISLSSLMDRIEASQTDAENSQTSYSIEHNDNDDLMIYHFDDDSYISTPTSSQLKNRYDFMFRNRQSANHVEYVSYDSLLSNLNNDLSVSSSGVTDVFPVVLSVSYNTSTHLLEQHTKNFTFENGLLKSVSNNFTTTTITQAVPEDL